VPLAAAPRAGAALGRDLRVAALLAQVARVAAHAVPRRPRLLGLIRRGGHGRSTRLGAP
jgi:hypothetical protein